MKPVEIFLRVVQVLLGLFFVYVGGSKLPDLSDFTQSVENFQMVDRPFDAYVAYFVPWLEVIVGMALIVNVGVLAGLTIFSTMMLGFSIAIAWVWHQGLNINCGCYGASDEPTNYPLHLTLNGILFLLGLGCLVSQIVFFRKKHKKSIS